jgi:hypothetical protein
MKKLPMLGCRLFPNVSLHGKRNTKLWKYIFTVFPPHFLHGSTDRNMRPQFAIYDHSDVKLLKWVLKHKGFSRFFTTGLSRNPLFQRNEHLSIFRKRLHHLPRLHFFLLINFFLSLFPDIEKFRNISTLPINFIVTFVNKIQYLDKIFLFLSLDSSYIFFFFGTGL